jgi:hypothetical protein
MLGTATIQRCLAVHRSRFFALKALEVLLALRVAGKGIRR